MSLLRCLRRHCSQAPLTPKQTPTPRLRQFPRHSRKANIGTPMEFVATAAAANAFEIEAAAMALKASKDADVRASPRRCRTTTVQRRRNCVRSARRAVLISPSLRRTASRRECWPSSKLLPPTNSMASTSNRSCLRISVQSRCFVGTPTRILRLDASPRKPCRPWNPHRKELQPIAAKLGVDSSPQ